MINHDKIIEELTLSLNNDNQKYLKNRYRFAKHEFIKYKETIIEALQIGVSKNKIFKYLKEGGYISMGRASFYKLCNQYLYSSVQKLQNNNSLTMEKESYKQPAQSNDEQSKTPKPKLITLYVIEGLDFKNLK